VTALVIDTVGNTSEFAPNIQVVGGGGGVVFIEDDFSRSLTDSWGIAPTGGAYNYFHGATANQSFDVNGGVGLLTIPTANLGREAVLEAVDVQDSDITVRFQTDQMPWGDSQDVLIIARWMNSGTMYRFRLRLDDNGSMIANAVRGVNNTWSDIGSMVFVSGVSFAPNTWINVRAQVVGVNPTTLRLKAWNDGQPEPSPWHLNVTDATAELQMAGSIGLRAYVNPSGTYAPVVFSFDDLRVASP
jgi:hypothetical protein